MRAGAMYLDEMSAGFEMIRCQKCGAAWKLPLTRAEVDQIVLDHGSRCDGEPVPRTNYIGAR